MGKVIDKNGNVIRKQDNQLILYTTMDFLECNHNYTCNKWDTLSELVKTCGDAITPFNTIGEMITTIPDIIDYGEECAILCVIDENNDMKWFILGYNKENNMEIANKVLHCYFPELEVVED